MKILFRIIPIALCLLFFFYADGKSHLTMAREEESGMEDMDALIEQSDLIIQGQAVEILQSQRETKVRIRVEGVFKGEPSQKIVNVLHLGGKFNINLEEPDFTISDRSILFLKHHGSSFKCVEGKNGKKTIRNDNIYPFPDNPFLSVSLSKYSQNIKDKITESAKRKGVSG